MNILNILLLGKEILETVLVKLVNLSDSQGNLNPQAIGWSRTPLKTCNLSHHTLRKKRWHYWAILSPEMLLSVSVSNVDYLGMVFVYILDFETKQFIEKIITTPFGKGCRISSTINDSVKFVNHDPELIFSSRTDRRIISSRDLSSLVKSSVHQMFGHYKASIKPEGKRSIFVRNILGLSEEHQARL
jgi:hypothetical protein